MPDIAVANLLQQEIIAALLTPPCSLLLNLVGGDGVYAAERLDVPDGYAPEVSPHIVVGMPAPSGLATMSAGVSQATFESELYLFQSQVDFRDADVAMTEFTNAVRRSLGANGYTASMRKVGGFRNIAVINNIGWGVRGQDQVYKMTVSYRLTFPASGVVVVDGGTGEGQVTNVLDGGLL